MILEKHFKFDPVEGFQATNISEINDYISEKIDYFRVYDNWKSKKEHLELYHEMLDMINEDLNNVDVDLSGVSSILYYDKIDKKKAVLYYDLVYVLGTISLNVFDFGKNALNHVEDGEHGAINLGSMVQYGYDELISAKKNNKPTYGATLALTTSIEGELKRKFKYIIQQELSKDVEKKIQNGTYSPSSDDRTLLDCLLGRKKCFNSIYVTTIGGDELFKKAEVYDASSAVSKEQSNLMLNKTTLNQMLQ